MSSEMHMSVKSNHNFKKIQFLDAVDLEILIPKSRAYLEKHSAYSN